MERTRRRWRQRGGFTLLEAVIASAVLALTVLAIGAAISAAQMNSLEGRKAVLGAMAAGDYMSELMTLPYNEIEAQDGDILPVGTLTTLDGVAYPEEYWALGRGVTAQEELMRVDDLGVTVRGLNIEVVIFDDRRVVANAHAFLPEPIEEPEE